MTFDDRKEKNSNPMRFENERHAIKYAEVSLDMMPTWREAYKYLVYGKNVKLVATYNKEKGWH